MNSFIDSLRQVAELIDGCVSDAFGAGSVRELSDPERVEVLALAASMSRRTEALMVESVGVIADEQDLVPHPERLTTRMGCRSMHELVQRVTRLPSRRVADLVAGATAVTEPVCLSSGDTLPAEYPGMRAALADGHVGVDGLIAVTSTLGRALCAPSERLAADDELAAAARGEGVDGGPAPCADDLRLQARVWATYLDQDGAAPRDSRAMRKRGLWLGVCRDGLVPVRGGLLPEVAAQLDTLNNAINNPRAGDADRPAGPYFTEYDDEVEPSERDERTRPQRLHDALATILTVAARSAEVPTLGGAAPTLVVSVLESDLRMESGFAHLDGIDEPVSLAVARHAGCGGTIQRVTTDAYGRIRAIHTLDRVFGAHQRKAITLRDGGCIIPGCHVPAAWCEIHHVTEHSTGGPTHCDNGVLLCWHHHRTLENSGWQIRMRNGVPEVRGPTWWDTPSTWRAVTTSPTRLRQRLAARRN